MPEVSRVVARAEPALAYHIRRVKTKIASGKYKMEEVSCFCGSKDSVQATEIDRYGIDYKMVICRNCGVMYANPRLTEASMNEFYATDYREIYDYGLDLESEFKSSIGKGNTLIDFLEYFDLHPKSVLDIGCNMGGMLKPFQDKGCTVLGVEIGGGSEIATKHGIPIYPLEYENILSRFDLVIMNHVLEHLGDLEAELAKVRRLISPGGYLFIGVPGLYAWDRNTLFQSAHNWQFMRSTLMYIMECCGFEEVYCDEKITSLWQYTGEARDKRAVDKTAFGAAYNALFSKDYKLPKVNGYNKFPVKTRRESMEFWIKTGIPGIDKIAASKSGGAVIVAGGPSIDDYVDKIRAMKADGMSVIAIERMYSWCLDHGIVPDYVIAMDASDDVVDSMSNPHQDTVHLISSQCPPKVHEYIKYHESFLFFTPQRGINLRKIWDEHKLQVATQVNAGGSVTLGAFSCAMTIGFDDIHIFGFDCHVTDGDYAKGITGVGVIPDLMEIRIEDRIFKTTPSYISFMQQFFDLYHWGKKGNYINRVRIYGDSLVSAASREDIRGE